MLEAGARATLPNLPIYQIYSFPLNYPKMTGQEGLTSLPLFEKSFSLTFNLQPLLLRSLTAVVKSLWNSGQRPPLNDWKN
jgi:hypothetical protein